MFALRARLGYPIGSVPMAWALTWAATGRDLRRLGSGNVGVMNVALSVGRWAGRIGFAGEAGKGGGAVGGARGGGVVGVRGGGGKGRARGAPRPGLGGHHPPPGRGGWGGGRRDALADLAG